MHQTLAEALKWGLRVRVSCNEPCRGTLHVALGRREVGHAAWRTSATVRIKLARKALAHRRRARLTVSATATDAAGNTAPPVRRTAVIPR